MKSADLWQRHDDTPDNSQIAEDAEAFADENQIERMFGAWLF
jgi:hypothetical protein